MMDGGDAAFQDPPSTARLRCNSGAVPSSGGGGLAALLADMEREPPPQATMVVTGTSPGAAVPVAAAIAAGPAVVVPAPVASAPRVLRVEVDGHLHDWFDVEEMGDFVRSPAFANTLRDNIERYWKVPVSQQAIYDEDGLLRSSADFSRALQRVNPMIYVYNLDQMAPELMEKTVEELDMIDEELKSWRQLRSRSARGQQADAKRVEATSEFGRATYAEGGSGGTPVVMPAMTSGHGGAEQLSAQDAACGYARSGRATSGSVVTLGGGSADVQPGPVLMVAQEAAAASMPGRPPSAPSAGDALHRLGSHVASPAYEPVAYGASPARESVTSYTPAPASSVRAQQASCDGRRHVGFGGVTPAAAVTAAPAPAPRARVAPGGGLSGSTTPPPPGMPASGARTPSAPAPMPGYGLAASPMATSPQGAAVGTPRTPRTVQYQASVVPPAAQGRATANAGRWSVGSPAGAGPVSSLRQTRSTSQLVAAPAVAGQTSYALRTAERSPSPSRQLSVTPRRATTPTPRKSTPRVPVSVESLVQQAPAVSIVQQRSSTPLRGAAHPGAGAWVLGNSSGSASPAVAPPVLGAVTPAMGMTPPLRGRPPVPMAASSSGYTVAGSQTQLMSASSYSQLPTSMNMHASQHTAFVSPGGDASASLASMRSSSPLIVRPGAGQLFC